MLTVRYIIGFLLSHGVRTVFGYPGANILPLFDALAASEIKLVVTRHEQGAVHAAAGYAKSSGRVGVCIATSGPGATNLVTGIADAALDSAPLLVITGQVRRDFIGCDAFQEADILGVTIPVTKHSALVRSPSDVQTAFEEGWDAAVSGRQGPVLIDIACDVLAGRVTERAAAEPHAELIPGVYDSDAAALRDMLAHSHRPLILAGGGVAASGAASALRRIIKTTGIPAALTMTALGVDFGAADETPLTLGMLGAYGSPAASAAFGRCDLLIAVGCRFSDRTVGDFTLAGRGRAVVHADIDAAEISKNVRADLGIVADAGDFLRVLEAVANEAFVARDYSEWTKEIFAAAENDNTADGYGVPDGDIGIDFAPYRLPRTLYAADVGEVLTAAAAKLRPNAERGFIVSAGLGAMGFGLPAAIGCAYAAADFGLPFDRVVLICGDGGFQMTLHELSTLKKAPLPVKIVLSDNAELGMVARLPHDNSRGASDAYRLDNPDFFALARAYGIDAVDGADRTAVDSAARDGEHHLIIYDTRRDGTK